MILFIISAVMLIMTAIIFFVVVTEMANFLMTRVPFVPTSHRDIADFVNRLNISSSDTFYDLGSGNGRVVLRVEKLTGAKAKGLQRAGWTQVYAKLLGKLNGSKAQFVSGDFFEQPWNDATVIYGYLYPPLMRQVGEKAMQDCRPGTKLVIRDFPIPNLTLADSWLTPSKHQMYLYVI